jgi:hypothetical protein
MIKAPQSFVTGQECDKVAFDNGFRRTHGELDGWRRYGSTTAQGSIWLAHDDSGCWLLSIDHAGVLSEIDLKKVGADGPGIADFKFSSLSSLYAVMPRLYELSVSLPDAPLQEFRQRTKDMPRTTEAERLVVQRIGQNIFRERLIDYWQEQCPLSGITDLALLRASHIKPWRDCESDDERLDVHNGILLSALWDAAFDKGLVTFSNSGEPVISKTLSVAAVATLMSSLKNGRISLNHGHQTQLTWHRQFLFKP